MPEGSSLVTEEQRVAAEFVLRLGRALDASGYPADQLADLLVAVAERLGLPHAETYTTATGVQIAFGPLGHQQTYLVAVRPGGTDLGRLTRLDALAMDVIAGRVNPVAGIARLKAIDAARTLYAPPVTVLAFALASAAFARVLGGGTSEIVAAGLIGALTGMLSLVAEHVARVARVFEPLAAFVASFVAGALAAALHPLAVGLVTLAGLVVLLPGLTLTIALQELSMRHLATGTARLSAALISFLGMVFGVAVGSQLAAAWLGAAHFAGPAVLAQWTYVVAVVVSGLAFTVILRAEPRDWGWILLATGIAVAAGRIGTNLLGPFGAFVGALAVGLAASSFAALRNRPALVMLVPGLLMLVPGSIGYEGFAALLRAETASGVQAVFQMFFTAVALVYGILFANLISPPRRVLGSLGRAYRRLSGRLSDD